MRYMFFLFLVSLGLGLSGCSRATLDTEFVTGVVTLDGDPIEGARVVFASKAGGTPAYGVTDKSGRYRITALQGGGTGKGTTQGEYLIAITKIQANKISEEPMIRYENVQLLPLVYSDAEQSQLTATVVKGKNEFNFDLKSKPDIEYVQRRKR